MGDEVDTSRQSRLQPPIDDNVAIESGTGRPGVRGRGGILVAGGGRRSGAFVFGRESRARRRRRRDRVVDVQQPVAGRVTRRNRLRVAGKAQRLHRVSGTQNEIEAEAPPHLFLSRPKGQLPFIDPPFLEGIDVTTNSGIDVCGLNVGDPNADVFAGANRPHRDVEGPVIVLFGNRCFSPRGLLFVVDPTRLFLGNDLTRDRFAVDPVCEFRDRCVFRHRERIDRLEVGRMRVAEHLLHGGDRVAVLDHHFDEVILDRQRRPTAVRWCQQAGGVAVPRHADKRHRGDHHTDRQVANYSSKLDFHDLLLSRYRNEQCSILVGKMSRTRRSSLDGCVGLTERRSIK